MITFDEHGNVTPYTLIETDLETFGKVFVTDFPNSETRKGIFQEYLGYLETLQSLGDNPFFQWIDGSFITQKINPNDIDLVTFLDYQAAEQYTKEIERLREARFENKSNLDGYFVKTYPETHPKRILFDTDLCNGYLLLGVAKTPNIQKALFN